MKKISGDDKAIINAYFSACLRKYGPLDAKSLSWYGKDTQQARYRVLTQIADLNNRTILDLGCGLGDFYGYLIDKNIKIKEYLGIDINQNLIYEARLKYHLAKFKIGDIYSVNNHFDYIIACGLFGYKLSDYQDKYFAVIKKMFAKSIKGIGFNLLDESSCIHEELCAYFDPAIVEKFVKKLSKNIKIIKGYLSNDFSIFVYK